MQRQNMHIHSKYSWDCERYGRMEIEEIAKILFKNDIKYGAITDHIEFDREDISYVINKLRVRNEEIDRVNELYQGKVCLLKSVEITEANLYMREVEKLDSLDLDFLMGSVHRIDRHATTEIGIKNAYEEYYRRMLNMVCAGQIDVVGHFDYINRYYQTDLSNRNQVEEILGVINEKNQILELNTSSKRRSIKPIFPSFDKLYLYLCNQNEVTIGTDAHKYEELVDNLASTEVFAEVLSLKPVVYQKRKRINI